MGTQLHNLYELLEVDEAADAEELTLAFRRAAKRWHPDHNTSRVAEANERMKTISAAYEVLRDPDRRAAYNLTLRDRRVSSPSAPDDGSKGEGESSVEAEELVAVLAESGPPPGFVSSHRHLRPRWSAAPRSRDRASALPWLGALALLACPFVPFLTAAWLEQDRAFLQWGALYALGPLLWALGAATSAQAPALAGRILLAAGALHVLCWRRRLYAAFASRRAR
jgi:hypothetical protein